MKLFSKQADQPFLTLFVLLGTLAVICGGMMSAFTAAQPTTFTAWTSAYLVLVVGVAQIGLGLLGQRLVHRHHHIVAWLGFALYNIGNIAVIDGVFIKETAADVSVLTDLGGVCIVLAVVAFFYGIYGAKWSWKLAVFYFVALVLVVSVPIGMILGR